MVLDIQRGKMIYNGEIPTVQAAIYTVPPQKTVEINLFRIVNEAAAAARTFTLFLNVSGTARAITPVNTELPIGAAFDDLPPMVLQSGNTIEAVADDVDVSWTINANEV